jgi:hypothetical protein
MRKNTTLILLLPAMAWMLGACSSDSTAPDDSLPPLSNKDVASQAGYLSAAIVEVAPLSLTYQGVKAADGEDHYDFPEDGMVQGRVHLEFRDGGAEGDLSDFDVADWAKAWTAAGEPLIINLVDYDEAVPLLLSFMLESDLDQESDPRTAVVNGGGQLVVGDYLATWTVDDLVVFDQEPYWPQSGSISFTSGGITATVTFNGTSIATVTVGDLTFDINLATGALIE